MEIGVTGPDMYAAIDEELALGWYVDPPDDSYSIVKS